MHAGSKARLGVLISGSGTNLQAIMDACAAGSLDAEVAVVVSDKPEAYGLTRARERGVPAIVVERPAHPDAAAFNRAIADVLAEHAVDVVVMAGYMRLLGSAVLSAYPDRVVNIHPALLPSFAGAHGIDDAFAYGVKVTGVTVHLANEEFDAGPIIAQEAVRIEEGDTVDTLEARIHEVEHRIYPEALQLLVSGRLRVEGRRVRLLPGA